MRILGFKAFGQQLAAFRPSAYSRASAAASRAMSSGSGEANLRRLPVTGCTKASSAACSAWRPSARERDLGRGAELAPAGLEAGAVGHVAEQRVADVGKMHADLVRSARLQHESEQAGHRLRLGLAGGARSAPAPRSALSRAGRAPRRRPRSWCGWRCCGPARHRSRRGGAAGRPTRSLCRLAPAGRRRRARRTARRGPGARGRSWRQPEGRWCPCRAGARYPVASRRRCPTATRRNGR